MRIFLFFNTCEIKENRNTFRATLINLPTNTNAHDLLEIINHTKAKTCYIPKDDEGNNKRLATLTFENLTDLNSAKLTLPKINTTSLEWTEPLTKLCHLCSSKDHQATNCPNKHLFTNKKLLNYQPIPTHRQQYNHNIRFSQNRSFSS